MNIKTKIIAFILIILPFASWAGFYWYAITMNQINSEFPNQKTIDYIKNIEDPKALQKLLISTYLSKQERVDNEVSVYHVYAEMLLSLAVFNAVFLFMFYKNIKKAALTSHSSGTAEKQAIS